MDKNRRSFLQSATTAAGISLASSRLRAGLVTMPGGAPPEANGEVPDTLDLVESGKHALNGLAGTLDWGAVPEFYFRVELRPPRFIHDRISFAACGPKYWEAFVMLRAMTASDRFTDIQQRYRQYVLSAIKDDGLFYCKIGPQRPWDTSSPEDYANIYGQGRIIRALIAEYDQNGDPGWLARARKVANKLAEIGIYKNDYVYFPTTPGYGDMFSYPTSGWKVTELPRGGPQAPTGSAFGIPMYLGGTILPLVRLAERTQDERTLELAQKLTRFLLLPESAWLPTEYARGATPGEHGQYRGQTHSHMMALRGILAAGVATNDNSMKLFAREGYEFSRTLGIARLGWFEEECGKHSHENCCLADMLSLAIQLSESGVGDYWDDVDGFVRNHLTASQFLDVDKLKSLNQSLTADQEQLLERVIGTYSGWGSPVALSTVLQNCCMANTSQALYSAWASIVCYDAAAGSARVNLLLNRTSPWLDVQSYLPYEGKVILRNRSAHRIYVRIPNWVDRRQLKCAVDGIPTPARHLGNYLLLDPVGNHSVIVMTFPVQEEVATFSLDDYGEGGWAPKPLATFRYRVTFRGNTAIDVVSLEGDQTTTYDGGLRNVTPVYTAYDDRGPLARNRAPMKRGIPSSPPGSDIRSW